LKKRITIFLSAALAAWIIVLASIHWVRSMKPTPEKIQAYLEKKGDLSALDSKSRAALLQRVADDMNRIDYRQQYALRRGDGAFNRFFSSITPEERNLFLERTLPRGYSQMMQAFNKMTPEQRKRIVERTLSDLDGAAARTRGPGDPALTPEQSGKMISIGLDAFYADASAETKMDLAPVVERFQQIMQGRQ
jgi:hypothetical protein